MDVDEMPLNTSDVDTLNNTVGTPFWENSLYLAIEQADIQMFKHLVIQGADVNYVNSFPPREGFSLLHLAAIAGTEEIVMFLLINGAHVDVKCAEMKTPLYYAVWHRHINIINLLLKYGACVNSPSASSSNLEPTLLHFAVINGNEEVVMPLVINGANLDAEDIDGLTPLHYAVMYRHIAIVRLLIKHGACIDSASLDSLSHTPLHWAVRTRDENTVMLLLSSGANVDAKAFRGTTALRLAVIFEYTEIVELLLKYGACAESSSKEEMTLLQVAAGEGYESVVKLLVLYGANAKTTNTFGDTACDIAIRREHTNLIEPLLNCSGEVECMKREKIGISKVSFYDILTKSSNHLALYALNENISLILALGYYKEKFPLYATMICNNYKKGIKRRNLFIEAEKHFSVIHKLPEYLSDNIMNFLSDEDVENLIHACKNCNAQ